MSSKATPDDLLPLPPAVFHILVSLAEGDRHGYAIIQDVVLGTPHYMAPEQLRGELVDHRGDQFSFCVALYEALYGQMPFAGADVQELRQSVEEGVLKEPPRGSKVPAPVRRALERGLSPDPNARFLDMGALLMALQGWERRHRRQLVVLALAAAITIGSMLYALMDKILSRPCDDAGAAVTELWTTGRRDSIRRAFASTGLSYAGASWSTLESHIHRYATQLASEMTDACEATHERHVQSTQLLDLRMLCLTSRQRLLKALLDQLERADASTVERAHAAASELPDLAMCQQVETFRHGMLPPARKMEAAVMSVRERLARARTLEFFGKNDDALRIARGNFF